MRNIVPVILCALLLVSTSCGTRMPVTSNLPEEQIATGPGPEDMVLDTLHGEARLILSCTARREGQESFGEIMSVEPGTGRVAILVRYGEPGGMEFRPHGIHLDGDRLLVINHEREPDLHPILVYRIHADSLELTDRILTPFQHSPNALVTGGDGDIYFVNDAGKRGSILEKALKLKRGSLVRLTVQADGSWAGEVVAERLGYPAGLNRRGDILLAGDAILHRIHVFRITGSGLEKRSAIKGIRGADNIRIHEGQLIVPGHVKPFRFIGHTKDPDKLSPVAVFAVDPASGRSSILYYTDGSSISAGSTALVYRGNLYISQIFEPYILKIHLSQ